MNARVDAQRRDGAIAVLGGPTTVIDIAGRRIVMDPTFDPPGVHAYLTKTEGPAVGADVLGPVDAVLISHDQHPDEFVRAFDQAGIASVLRVAAHGEWIYWAGK